MTNQGLARSLTALAATVLVAWPAWAGVTAQEAARLNSELTPLGAEKAGNKDGTIPAWTGGFTGAIAGETPAKRGDPFKDEKPLLTITAQNMAQHADKLSEGVQAMLKKYPDSFKVNVYKTNRTAVAPQWVYDNTFKNATRASLGADGAPAGAYGGIPFPLAKTGEEMMWNHLLRWRGDAWQVNSVQYQMTGDGRHILTSEGFVKQQMPYYAKDGSPETFKGNYWDINLTTDGPPIRAGEAIVGREHLDADKSAAYVYLTGQRRVRKLPNACCDAPTPASAGLMSFDELNVWSGRLDRFDWKIVGKKEIYVPYNSNRWFTAKSNADLMTKNHLNPEYVRWELHRVWVVESTLKPGQRHQAPKGRYYLDEDTWGAVLGDRWDANGQLWKTLYTLPLVMPDIPAVVQLPFGYNDLLSGTSYVTYLLSGDKVTPYRPTPKWPDVIFTGDGLAAQGVR